MIKVLIVEDDYLHLMILQTSLELKGHTVVGAASSGMEAIRFVKEVDLDVILMDIGLEGELDGVETMLEIAKFSSVPVIYITGTDSSQIKEKAKKTNMIAYCSKPIELEVLLHHLSEVKGI